MGKNQLIASFLKFFSGYVLKLGVSDFLAVLAKVHASIMKICLLQSIDPQRLHFAV
jgi:hypothetical protein